MVGERNRKEERWFCSAGDITLLELLHDYRETTKLSYSDDTNEENCTLWRVEDVQYHMVLL